MARDANAFEGIGNWFTGNLDAQRREDEIRLQHHFSALEAEKARKFSEEQAKIARDFNANEAKIAREWQERMSNTAYSRAIKDLKSVGINPYAIGSFNAASTPSAAYGQAHNASSYSASGGGSSYSSSNQLGAIANSAAQLFSIVAKIAFKK